MMKFIGLMLAVAICAVSPLLAGERKPAPASSHSKSSENAVTFVSATGEKLTASYDIQADNVTLALPDGATARLPRAISGSGARYADGRMVFWEHQGEASVWIGEKLIFKGAHASQTP